MDLSKLKSEIGKRVFVVSQRFRTQRDSEYGTLDSVNEPNNIIVTKQPFGDSVIPLDNESDKILKVYNREGNVVYDAEIPTKKKTK